MKKQNILFVLAALALTFASASAFAQEVQLPQQDAKLESTGQLALRATSPDAAFGTKGEKIGWVKQGETVKVLSVKQVSTVYGFEVWIEVEAENHTKGWVFDGMAPEVLGGKAHLSAASAPALLAQAN